MSWNLKAIGVSFKFVEEMTTISNSSSRDMRLGF